MSGDMKELEEDRTYHLRENVTGAGNGECSFCFRFGEREAEFFFGVRDEDVISPFQEDNEDIWQGDSVEVFLSPDGNPEHYWFIQCAVATQGPDAGRYAVEIGCPSPDGPRLWERMVPDIQEAAAYFSAVYNQRKVDAFDFRET